MITMNKKEITDKLRDIPIVDILGIKKGYSKTMIKCPFHNDSTPSMSINNNNGFFCFGCGKRGFGAIDFLVAGGLTFKESVSELIKFIQND